MVESKIIKLECMMTEEEIEQFEAELEEIGEEE